MRPCAAVLLLLRSTMSPPRASIFGLARKSPLPSAPDPVSFEELGCSPPIVEALSTEGIIQPLEAQVAAWEALRHSTRDVAIVAEAGSGKTLAYLLPLCEALLEELKSQPDQSDDFARQGASTGRGGSRTRRVHVVVPTPDLVSQVKHIAATLCELTPLRVASATEVGRGQMATSDVHLVVGTAPESQPLLTGRDCKRDTLAVVFDECDYMLAGVRATGGKAGASPAAAILEALCRRTKPPKKGKAAGSSAGNGREGRKGDDGRKGKEGTQGDAESPRMVFVSATVPGQGSKSVGAFLDSRVKVGLAVRPCVRLASWRCRSVDGWPSPTRSDAG